MNDQYAMIKTDQNITVYYVKLTHNKIFPLSIIYNL